MGVKVRWNRAKSAWYLYVNHNKRRVSQAFGANEKAAREAAKEVAKAIKLGNLSIKQKKACPTLSEFSADWLRGNTTRKASTIRQYTRQLNRNILPKLGNQRLDAINRATITSLLSQDLAHLSRKSGELVLAVLTVIFGAAVEAGIIESNPALRQTRAAKRPDRPVREVEAMNAEQVAKFLQAVSDRHGEVTYLAFLVMARTGVRIGEAVALQRSAVDLERRRIKVSRTLTEDGTFSTPKSGKVRYVDMSQQLVDELREYLQTAPATPEGLLLPTSDGKPFDPRLLRERFAAAIAAVVDFKATPHTLRHSYASQLLGQGAPIHYVQQQLGHANPTITLNIYGHFLRQDNVHIVDGLDSIAARRIPDASQMQPTTVFH